MWILIKRSGILVNLAEAQLVAWCPISEDLHENFYIHTGKNTVMLTDEEYGNLLAILREHANRDPRYRPFFREI